MLIKKGHPDTFSLDQAALMEMHFERRKCCHNYFIKTIFLV